MKNGWKKMKALILLILFILVISFSVPTAKSVLSDKLELYLKFLKKDGTPLSNAYVELRITTPNGPSKRIILGKTDWRGKFQIVLDKKEILKEWRDYIKQYFNCSPALLQGLFQIAIFVDAWKVEGDTLIGVLGRTILIDPANFDYEWKSLEFVVNHECKLALPKQASSNRFNTKGEVIYERKLTDYKTWDPFWLPLIGVIVDENDYEDDTYDHDTLYCRVHITIATEKRMQMLMTICFMGVTTEYKIGDVTYRALKLQTSYDLSTQEKALDWDPNAPKPKRREIKTTLVWEEYTGYVNGIPVHEENRVYVNKIYVTLKGEIINREVYGIPEWLKPFNKKYIKSYFGQGKYNNPFQITSPNNTNHFDVFDDVFHEYSIEYGFSPVGFILEAPPFPIDLGIVFHEEVKTSILINCYVDAESNTKIHIYCFVDERVKYKLGNEEYNLPVIFLYIDEEYMYTSGGPGQELPY